MSRVKEKLDLQPCEKRPKRDRDKPNDVRIIHNELYLPYKKNSVVLVR
jgi:hypothetical protein